MAVWYKDSKGVDHYGTPSSSSEKSSVSSSTQPSGSLSSSGSGSGGSSKSSGNSGGSSSNSSTNINTSGLSGYALAYANARNSGKSDTEAHAAATQATGNGGKGGTGTSFTTYVAGSGNNGNGTTTYNLDGLGGYAPAGDTSQIQTTVPTTIIPTANQDQIKALLATIPTAPNYQYQPYQQTIPDYSITGNKGDVTYLPTVKSRQLWNDTQQQNADNAYKTYSANINNWSQAAQQLQNAIVNAQKERDYEQKTIADRAAEARQAVADKTAADKAAWERDPNNPDNILKLKQADYYDTRGGSSGGSGGLTAYQQYQAEQAANKSESESEATFNKRVDDLASKSFAEDSSYTLNQWRDAWRIQLLSEMGQ